MKFAKFIKLGGELLEASQADYSDYKGFLLCPECGEPVFLRKAHKRGEVLVGDAFVHHRAVPEFSQCEKRVGKYSQSDADAARSAARGQRLQKLQVSLWKYLKTNMACDFKQWSKVMADAKRQPKIAEVARYAIEICKANRQILLNDALADVSSALQNASAYASVAAAPGIEFRVERFVKSRNLGWALHLRIAAEALEFTLDSKMAEEALFRLACVVAHPSTMEYTPDLLDLDMATKEWRSLFLSHVLLSVALIFLSVDWIEVLND